VTPVGIRHYWIVGDGGV